MVPLETRNASVFAIAFDNTNGVMTGVALANIANQVAKIPVLIYDDNGAQIGTDKISLAAQGHSSFSLGANYTIAQGKRGTIEFQTPLYGQIAALGLRFNGNAFTTLPVIAEGTEGGSLRTPVRQQLVERFRSLILNHAAR